jgi:sugar lactone lactonase YvrE
MRNALLIAGAVILLGLLPACTSETSSDGQDNGPAADPTIDVSGFGDVVHVLSYPTRVAVGPSGNVYVTDAKTGSLFELTADGRPTREIQGLHRPLGVAVAADGRIFVGVHQEQAVAVLDGDGHLLKAIGGIAMPNDLALAADGTLYVADSAKDVVRVYGADLSPKGTIGRSGSGAGQFRFPSTVAVADGTVYVGDQLNHRVQVFGSDGKYMRTIGGPTPEQPAGTEDYQGTFSQIAGIAASGGDLYIADSYQSRLQVLSATGEFLRFAGRAGTAAGQTYLPLDVAVGADGRVYVANAKRHEVMILAAGGTD